MIRAIGNLFLIVFLFAVIYAARGVVAPVVQKVGTYVSTAVVTFQNEYGLKKALPELDKQPEKEIATPGPLEVKTPPTTTETPASGITKASIIYWTNQARKENGNLPPLTENKVLNGTATAKTNDLFAKSYFEHTSPSGVTVATQAQGAGYEYIMIGENLALGNFASGEAIVDAWMNSPGHRANILNDRYTEIGIGVSQGTYQGRTVWIATQHFGLPKNACPIVEESLKNTIAANQSKIDQLKVQIEAKKREVDSTSQLSSEYNNRVNEYNALVREFNDLVGTTKTEISTYNNQVQAYNACVQG